MTKIRVAIFQVVVTLPENKQFAPENQWLEDEISILRWPIFRGELLTSTEVWISGTTRQPLGGRKPTSPQKKLKVGPYQF